jgi:hypothetical protein
MLLYLLLNSDANPPVDTVGNAARAYSWSLRNRLQQNPQEIPLLLNAMTHICSGISASIVHDWVKKLQVMPGAFYFGTHIVLHREYVAGGVLMIAETTMYPLEAQHMGMVGNVRTILPMMYFARTNTETGAYEVRTLPPRVPREFEAAGMFGQQFLDMIRQMPAPVEQQPQVIEEKKSWWKKITGK